MDEKEDASSPPADAIRRRFAVVGQTASASGDFSTEDLPGSSGRIDVLLRSLRAALLVSHGLRRNVLVYLVLRGGERAPRVLRVNGKNAKFLRPDERSLAILVKKSLMHESSAELGNFQEVRPGLSVAEGDIECVLRDSAGATPYLLDERGSDLRSEAFNAPDLLFFLGDHLGLDEKTLVRLAAVGARNLNVGPLSLHTDDVVTLVSNQLDRQFDAQPWLV